MPTPDLERLFESLVLPMPDASGAELAAVPIPGADNHRLAKDAAGSPCVLISERPQTTRSAPIKLENLTVSFEVPCVVRQPSGTIERGAFTIVRCSNGNPGLFPHFLKILSPVISSLGPSPTSAAVRRSVLGLIELFQALNLPSRKTIQGVWAELLLIRLARDPLALTTAWHREAQEHFDFSAGADRLEVKSSSTRRREHYFSLEQLMPARGARIIVASVFVERSGGGVSVQVLFDATRALLAHNTAAMAQFDAVFYSALGSGWTDAMDESFDWELATDSIAFYTAEVIPRPENPVPQSVFDVNFRADLGSVLRVPEHDLDALGGIFAAVVPQRIRR